MRPLRSASVSVGAAFLLAVAGPRSARAAEQLEAPTRPATSRPVDREPPLAFLGARPKTEQKIFLGEIDLGSILSKRDARQFTSKRFIFSDKLTVRSPLQEELDELEHGDSSRKGKLPLKGLAAVGISAAGVYGSVVGVKKMERGFKAQEKRDIEEEIELTGSYTSFDAGDVEGAVDPNTGKNITVAKTEGSAQGGAVSKFKRNADGSQAAPEKRTWLEKFLGASESDDDFWDKAEPLPPPPKGSGEDAGGGDAEGPGPDDEEEGDDSGIDTLDDLLS